MIVQCAWCKKVGPEKKPLKDKSVTHGICPDCAKKFSKNPREPWRYSESARAWYLRVGPDSQYYVIRESPRAFSLSLVINNELVKKEIFSTQLAAKKEAEERSGGWVAVNPGEVWHQMKETEANQQDRHAKKPLLKEFFHGKAVAHLESGLQARADRMTRKTPRNNPLAIFGFGNPPEIRATVAGVIYKRCIEVKAQKVGKWQHGFWKHEFDAKSDVCVLALDNGDILLHSLRKVRLWKRG